MQPNPNHKLDLQTIADSLVSKFEGTPKASKLLDIQKRLEALSEDSKWLLAEIEVELEALSGGVSHG